MKLESLRKIRVEFNCACKTIFWQLSGYMANEPNELQLI